MRETYELLIKAPTRLLRGQKGFTLVEMIIVVVILGIIGGITFQFVAYGVEAFKKSNARKELHDQGRLALERMTRELRDAKQVTASGSDNITFKVAHPSAYGVVDEIKYQLNGTDLERVGDPSGTPLTAVLAGNVDSFQINVTAGGGGGDTIDQRVSFNEDDSEESSGGSIDWGSSDLELVNNQQVGMRWRNITIPQGATITSAYIEFTVDEVSTGTPVNLTFYGEDADDAAVFQNVSGDISSRTKTTASVAWDNVPTWPTVGETHQSPDISPVIQEIVDRLGWASGNALVVIVTGSGRRTAESHDGVPASAPLLHVVYETGGGGGTNLVMVTGDGTTTGGVGDSTKRTLFEGWGWTVTAIDDNTADYSTAASSNDVMYISESSSSSTVGTKPVGLDIGIVVEEDWCWDNLGFGTPGDGGVGNDTMNITDNSHYITSPFSTGNLVVYTVSDNMGSMGASGTLASGGQLLATENSGNTPTLFVFDTGASLVSGTAANRRVGFPSKTSIPTNWNADLETLLQRSLNWAAGNDVTGNVVTLELTLSSPEGGTVSMRTKVFMRNVP